MMELRPIQAALLAGRAASRRATANPSPLLYSLAPSFYRSFSSTRPFLSEAEATAPPTPSMQEWSRQQQERQQQQQQSQPSGQPQRPAWGRPATSSPGAPAGLASLLQPAPSQQPPPTGSAPAPSPDPRRSPWESPQSPALRRAQEKRLATAGNNQPVGIFDELKELGLMGPTGEDLMRDISAQNNESIADVKYRLRPSIGRTVHLDPKKNVDLARGLSLLNTRVRVNKVSQDVNKQRFHERPGLKRKRLRRERWRARFKEGFKATCKRVQELARQGW